MIVAERLNGTPPVIQNPRSRTMLYQPTAHQIRNMRASYDTPNLEVTRLRGLGDGMGSVPSWVPWAAGGLALGVGVGYAVYRMRKKKR
jgi:hypothetical protein